jgi:hypothetical protein
MKKILPAALILTWASFSAHAVSIGICIPTTCSAGYYVDTAKNACTQCPVYGTFSGTSETSNNSSILGCFIPNNQTDANGAFNWDGTNGRCYYK